jgi:hypothetical protein
LCLVPVSWGRVWGFWQGGVSSLGVEGGSRGDDQRERGFNRRFASGSSFPSMPTE